VTLGSGTIDDMPERGPHLRVVAINDVYSLENFPRLATLIEAMRREDPADVFITTLAGDFVAPSMLSSLDAGAGMVDCLNALPITHVCLGNHEDDIPLEKLHERIAQYRGVWLSTNVLELDERLQCATVIEVASPRGRSVKVGLIGVVMDDPSAYHGKPFGDARVLPPNATARAAARHLVDEEGCACVLPLTHQSIDDDRALAASAEASCFPVILGGHEHQVFLERGGPSAPLRAPIVKAGSDAVHAYVIDLRWPIDAPARGGDLPSVELRLVDAASYAEDPEMRARVDRHMRPVHALEGATLLPLADGEELSSIGTRMQQTSLGTLIASRLRDALGADACVFNGGGIRASRSYRHRFTFGDLKGEVPFDNTVVVASMPGAVLADAIRASRSKAPLESGGFLQVDDGTTVDATHQLRTVAGAPFDPERRYRVAMIWNLFTGMDHIEPLVAFAKAEPASIPAIDTGREVKSLLVESFARTLWQELGGFDAIDENHDGKLEPDEIAHAIERATREPASPITVDLLLRAIDRDRDSAVSREEWARAARR
jgi:2',3'-cyclic-nucleotide 2'-phosphodiesterase (5'-nucleotidase family)